MRQSFLFVIIFAFLSSRGFADGWNPVPPSVVAVGQPYVISATHTSGSGANFVAIKAYRNGSFVDSASSGGPTFGRYTVSYSHQYTDTSAQSIDYRLDGLSNAGGANPPTVEGSLTATVVIDTSPTADWVIQPAGHVSVNQSFTLQAHGHDNDANLISVVESVDGNSTTVSASSTGTTDLTTPVGTFQAPPTPGTIHYHVLAKDALGLTVQVDGQVIVDALANNPPTIAWVSMPASVPLNQAFNVQATGSDADGNLSNITIWRNNDSTPFTSKNGSGGSMSTDPLSDPASAVGTVTYRAVVTDATGLTSTIIQIVSIGGGGSTGGGLAPPTAPTSNPPTAGAVVGALPGSFTVDNKGAGDYSMPLRMPLGRSGLEPNLSLDYSSASGNGPLGIGFSVSTGFPQAITRGRSILARDGIVRGVTFNDSDPDPTKRDKLYLDGKRLICVSGSYGQAGSTYRTEVDSFAIVSAIADTADGTGVRIGGFVMSEKSGNKFYFGKYSVTNDGYQSGILRNASDTVDPFAYTWALKRVEDTLGNSVDFTYATDAGDFVLTEIDYTANSSLGVAAHNRIIFSYLSDRFDKSLSYVAGRRFAHEKRLEYIMASTFDGGSWTDRAEYYLSYQYSTDSARLQIASVTGALSDGSTGALNTLPPTQIVWSHYDQSTLATVSKSGIGTGLGLESHDGYRVQSWGDFDGDGKEDYLDVSAGFSVFRSTGNQFVKTNWGSAPNGAGTSWGIIVVDLNGDGRKDLLLYWNDLNNGVSVQPYISTYTQAGGNSFQAGNTIVISSSTSGPYIFDNPGGVTNLPHDGMLGNQFSYLRRQVKGGVASRLVPGDFYGDGCEEVLVHGYDGFRYLLRWNRATGQLELTAPMNPGAPGDKPLVNVVFLDTVGTLWGTAVTSIDWPMELSPQPCDLNGDGITDYVWMEKMESIRFSAPNSHGVTKWWMASVSDGLGGAQPGAPGSFAGLGASSYSLTTDPNLIDTVGNYTGFLLAGDFNGDGLTDFIRRSAGGWQLMINKGSLNNGQPTFEYAGGLDSTFSVNGETLYTASRVMPKATWDNQFQSYVASSGSDVAALARIQADSSLNTFFMDVNHDGLADLVWFVEYKKTNPADPLDFRDTLSLVNKGWWVAYSTGKSFQAPQKLTGGIWDTLATMPQGYASQSLGIVTILQPDLNGDGLPDWVVNKSTESSEPDLAFYAYSTGTFGDLVKTITNGVGQTTNIVYKAAKDDSVYTAGVATISYPIREMRASQPVVSDVYQDSGDGAQPAQFSYQYSGNYLDLSGRGSLGFHSFVTLDRQTNVFKYQFLTQSFPMTGLASREQTYRWWGTATQTNFRLISSHDNTVVFDEVVNGPGGSRLGTVYPFISKAIESRWEDSDTPHFTLSNSKPAGIPDPRQEDLFPSARPAGAHISIAAQSWFDEQPLDSGPQTTLPGATGFNPSDANGFPGTSTVSGTASFSLFDGLPGKITFGNLRKLTTDFGDGFTETVTTTYLSAPIGTNLTGLIDTVSTNVTSTAYGPERAPDKKYIYSGNTPLVSTETVDASVATPANATLSLTTTYERNDVRKRVTAVRITSTDPTVDTFTVSRTSAFNDQFDLPSTVNDTYSHATTTVYDSVWGLPRSVTDVNGVQVSTSYDALGRTTHQTRSVADQSLSTDNTFGFTTPSATDWTKTQTVSGGGGLSLASVYAIRTTATVKPAVTAYYDRLGRRIRVIKEGFAGQTATTDTVYNKQGQLVAVSNPYASGASVLWTTSEYDALGRVAKVTAPIGTVTTNTYNGRSTSVEVSGFGGNGIAQKNTTLVDAKGRTVSVWNADNSTTTPSISFGLDGFGRMRTTTLKGQTQTISATYDALGRQLTLNDPDKGLWSYTNNALGQVVQQTDANGTVTATTYDHLGRALTRTTTQTSGPVETASWFYYDVNASAVPHGVALGSKGWTFALQREESFTSGASGYTATPTSTTHYYDNKGQPNIDLTTIDGKWFYTYTNFDSNGRVDQVRHYWRPGEHEAPADAPYVWRDFGYSYAYDGKSYLLSLTDSANRTWWAADTTSGYDFLDRPVLIQKGSAYWTQRTYRAADGVLTGIATGPKSGSSVSATVQNLSFGYDGLGNLTSRGDTLNSGSETYAYDVLNRLTQLNGTPFVAYADNGNISSKKDVSGTQSQTYSYDGLQPHAVSSAWGYSMGYDGNGNMISRTGGGQIWTTGWTGFDKPRWLAKNNIGSEFHYNAARSRVMHLEFDQLTSGVPSHYNRKKIYALGSTMEVDYRYATVATTSAWKMDRVRIYVPGPDGIAGTMEFDSSVQFDHPEKALVYHYDHLGSIERITPFGETSVAAAPDEEGNPARYSYDAWGQRRNADSWSGAPTTTAKGGHTNLTPRGFTGHEMIDDIGLVHMNGRIYDPLLGRFLSADLQVQFPSNAQSYNRYSYVQNNPLSFFDPSGWGLSPASAAMGWDMAVQRNNYTPAQQHAVNSGYMAGAYTYLVSTASSFMQAAVLSSPSPMPMPTSPEQMKLAEALKTDTDAHLADAKAAIMKADGVDPKLGSYWDAGNSTFGIHANLGLLAAPMAAEMALPANEARLSFAAPELTLRDSVPSESPTVFRGEAGNGEAKALAAFDNGLIPHGGPNAEPTTENLLASINDSSKRAGSAFVQASESADIATAFATNSGSRSGVMFEIKPTTDMINIGKSELSAKVLFPEQKIVAFPKGVPRENILRARLLDKKGNVLNTLENPNAQ